MTVYRRQLEVQLWETDYSRPYWEGINRRTLVLPWCTSCGKPHFQPRPFCPYCWGDSLEWREASGLGVIYSLTTVRGYPPSPFATAVPYGIAIVRLKEGVQMLTNVEISDSELGIDSKVRVEFRPHADRLLPFFVRMEQEERVGQ
jgi:uncharacterized OB-fold protein